MQEQDPAADGRHSGRAAQVLPTDSAGDRFGHPEYGPGEQDDGEAEERGGGHRGQHRGQEKAGRAAGARDEGGQPAEPGVGGAGGRSAALAGGRFRQTWKYPPDDRFPEAAGERGAHQQEPSRRLGLNLVSQKKTPIHTSYTKIQTHTDTYRATVACNKLINQL